MKSKYKVLILLFLLTSISLSSAYLFLPEHFQSLDSRFRDFYFKFRGPQKADESVVIVDIDEKSIKELGQWPWERNKFAQVLQNLTDSGAGIIGLDIVFSEEDKTSPKRMAKEWHIDADTLPDYDAILANTISQTPTIVGYVFNFDNEDENEAPQIPAIILEKNKLHGEYLPQAKGVLTNLEVIQSAAYSSGYMNNIPDDSGIIRSVPMLIGYDMEVFPSLAFEMYRISIDAKKITVNYGEAGIDNVSLGDEQIKSDRFGRIYLNFRGPFKSYRYISAVDVYNNSVDTSFIEGKYILIGTSAYGLMDLRSTPMDSVIAGVELHANMIDNLLHKDMLHKPSWVEVADLFSIVFVTFVVFFLFSRLSFIPLMLIYTLAFASLFFVNYYILFHEYVILNSIFPMMAMVISLVGVLGVNYMFETRLKELIKGSFSKKVSKQVMEDLLQHPDSTNLTSREENVTIYFSDIRSFTSISETLHSPKRITDFLNFYMNAMVESVEKNSGTIDKFIGDAVMAYWNAPLKVENHPDKAVSTALEQISKRAKLNETINKEFGFEVDYGIGLNTGDVVVGEIGSQGRSDYTIIGDSVNLASRLEGLCKAYKVRLVISEFTKELLKQEYVMQLLDIVRVKGKHEPVRIYEVLDFGTPDENKKIELDLYNKAHDLYASANFSEAQTLFNELYEKHEKYLYELYSKRCDDLMANNITEFDGIFEFTSK